MDAPRVTLTLVSHTNVGKTTLARTLLGRDIGEVRDAAHVTEFVESHQLLRAGDGSTLILADTPGFGDSHRLAARMRQSGSPIGWFLSQVWDRWRDRAFWGSQQALRAVRDEADVMLYLVNAAESPATAAYVAPEMELLGWLGKPVLVLLNQLGPPGDAAQETADLERWREYLAAFTFVRAVMPLDAFARCWVQEGVLLRAVQQALAADKRAAMGRLREVWAQTQEERFAASMQALAQALAHIASSRVPLADSGWLDRMRRAGQVLGLGSDAADAGDQAREALGRLADAEVRESTAKLLALHHIDGSAQGEILERVAAQVVVHQRVGEGRAALIGGMLSGALVGLKADLASGGLTFGGGALAGGVIGALGAAGVARGINVLRGTEQGWAAWPDEALAAFAQEALLRYLAVAHFGRGRGQWSEGEAPAHWRLVVEQALPASEWPRSVADREDVDALAAALGLAARHVLAALYPQAAVPVPAEGAESRA